VCSSDLRVYQNAAQTGRDARVDHD